MNGTNANKDEKFRATQYVQQVRSDRGGKAKVEVLEEDQTSSEHEIFKSLKAGVSKNSVKRVSPRTLLLKGYGRHMDVETT